MRTASTRVTPWPSSPSASTMCSTSKVQFTEQYSNYNVVNRDRNTSVVSILFPRHVEITRETFIKSGVSLGNIGEQKQNTLFYEQLNISVAEVGGYLGMILGVSLLDLAKFFRTYLIPLFQSLKKSNRF